MQPRRRYGIGAVDYHTAETVMIVRRRKRRKQSAEILEALLDRHPSEASYVAWGDASAHQDDEVEAVVRGASGCLVLLYLPTSSPWLNPIEMLWRHFRREVTRCEHFGSLEALVEASLDFLRRYNARPERYARSSGRTPQLLRDCT